MVNTCKLDSQNRLHHEIRYCQLSRKLDVKKIHVFSYLPYLGAWKVSAERTGGVDSLAVAYIYD